MSRRKKRAQKRAQEEAATAALMLAQSNRFKLLPSPAQAVKVEAKEIEREVLSEFSVRTDKGEVVRMKLLNDFTVYIACEGLVEAEVPRTSYELRRQFYGGHVEQHGAKLLKADRSSLPPGRHLSWMRNQVIDECKGEAVLILCKAREATATKKWLAVVPKQEATSGGVDSDDLEKTYEYAGGGGYRVVGTMHLHPSQMYTMSGTDRREWEGSPGLYVIAPRGEKDMSLWGSVEGEVFNLGRIKGAKKPTQPEGVLVRGEDGREEKFGELIRSPAVHTAQSVTVKSSGHHGVIGSRYEEHQEWRSRWEDEGMPGAAGQVVHYEGCMCAFCRDDRAQLAQEDDFAAGMRARNRMVAEDRERIERKERAPWMDWAVGRGRMMLKEAPLMSQAWAARLRCKRSSGVIELVDKVVSEDLLMWLWANVEEHVVKAELLDCDWNLFDEFDGRLTS